VWQSLAATDYVALLAHEFGLAFTQHTPTPAANSASVHALGGNPNQIRPKAATNGLFLSEDRASRLLAHGPAACREEPLRLDEPRRAARCRLAPGLRETRLPDRVSMSTNGSSSINENEIRAALNRHWVASDANDFDVEHDIYREDALLEYPQSGERIKGRHNIQASRVAQPSSKRFTVRRIVGTGDSGSPSSSSRTTAGRRIR
jgi:hypothetical protein